MKRLLCIVGILCALSVPGFAQGGFGGGGQATDDHNDSAPVQTGYAVVTPATTNTGITVMETFGLKENADATNQAGFLPPELMTSGSMFVDVSDRLSRNFALAIANPYSSAVSVNLILRKNDGTQLGTRTFTLQGRSQTAQFVTEMIPISTSGGGIGGGSTTLTEYTGTLSITANSALSIIGIRFRGANFSTVPVTNLSAGVSNLPIFSQGVGGTNAFLLPQFAANGGWATQIAISNSNSSPAAVRVDLFKQDGTPLTATLNRTTNSTFQNLTVPANGVLVLSPRDTNGDDRF
jgi:hypothetical protein